MTDRLEWTLKSLGRVKGDRLLLRDDGQPYAVKQMRALIAQAQVEAGLQETGNMHILRHTFCTRLAMKGVPPVTIQKLAGHVHLSTTLSPSWFGVHSTRSATPARAVPSVFLRTGDHSPCAEQHHGPWCRMVPLSPTTQMSLAELPATS